MEITKNLEEQLVRLVKWFKSMDNVECIYLLPYKKNLNYYNLVILFDNWNFDEIEMCIGVLNKQFLSLENIEENNGILKIEADCARKYIPTAVNPSDVRRVKDLYSSTILYTKRGKGVYYNKVANQFKEYGTLDKYTNTLKINKGKIKQIIRNEIK